MRTVHLFIVLGLFFHCILHAQTPDISALEKGINLLETKVYTEKENARILKLYAGLRVAEKVAEYAQAVLKGDKAGRRALYESLGRPLDRTVQ